MRKKVSLMCFLAARSSRRGVFGPLGPSSKVMAMYGPSTLTWLKEIFAVVREAGCTAESLAPEMTGGAGVAVAAAGAGEEAGDGAMVWAPASEPSKKRKKA